MNASQASNASDKSGQLSFVNRRAEWWWDYVMRLTLWVMNVLRSPDRELLSDLAAPRFRLTARGIQVEFKDTIIRRIGNTSE